MTSSRLFLLKSLLLALLLAISFSRVHAQDASQVLAERYPSGSIETAARAEAALDDIAKTRADIDRLYSNERIACFERFFATACTNDVREKRRAALTKIRKIEVEANALLRKEKAAERDRALAERDVQAKQQPGRSLPISGTVREPEPNTRDASETPGNRQP